MENKYNYTEYHKTKNIGKDYDEKLYSVDGWSSRIWEIEKFLLKRILSKIKPSSIMDFAAGTGRVSKYLEEIKFKNITAVDSSQEMLSMAQNKLKSTKILCCDITKEKNRNRIKEKFDVILAFRFFLNADKPLRENVIRQLNKLLKNDGRLIFNIHQNKHSIMYIKNLIRRKKNTLSVKDIRNLLKIGDFEIEEIYSYGFIPHWRKRQLLKFDDWIKVEKKLISKKILLGTHLMAVAKKRK
ncbi:class I SAM-dependent methyltransferase [Candidatus Pacearchaeota archaeon]|nr:class I SAM-dependent methyltransferase [Candidatus Pacearchaeota archaeon]